MKALGFAIAIALAGCGGTTPSPPPSSGSGGASAFVCQPTPSCGGAYVGTFAIDHGCSVASVPLAGCGMFEIDFAAAKGGFSFTVDGAYTATIDLGESGEVTIPATCTGVKSCNAFDTALLACTGNPGTGCTCKGIAVNESGTYVEADGALELTPKGPPVLKTVGSWCADADSIEIEVANAVVLRGTKS